MPLEFDHLTDDEWFDVIAGKKGPKLFNVPDEKIQTGTVGRSGEPILRDAFMFYQFTKRMLVEHGNGLANNSTVMDFGCAWARILRFWLHDIDARNLFGFEVQERLLSLARRDVPGPSYIVSDTRPPLPDKGDRFDLIYAFSVFSHLPAELADSWVQEFSRVLKPGGIVCLTTRPRAHIEVAGTAEAKSAHASLYAKLIQNKDAALAKYDSGEFIFYPAHGGGSLRESDYGEAIIPEEYVKANWGRHLEFIGFYQKYTPTYLQPCFVLRKTR